MQGIELEPALLRGREAAAYLGMSRASIYALAAEGILPVIRFRRNKRESLRFRKADLDRWIEEHRIPAR